VRVGDLVEYEGDRWKVTGHNRDFRVCILTNWERTKREVPDDADVPTDEGPTPVTVICNPNQDWPFVQARIRSESAGPVQQILRGGTPLAPLHDWVPSGLYRPGGPIYFNPTLRLRIGEVLVAVHAGGARGRIGLGKQFGTAARRKARAEAPKRPAGPKTRFDRILADPFGEDE